MDSLSKAQKDEFAVSFAILALYDGGVSVFLSEPWRRSYGRGGDLWILDLLFTFSRGIWDLHE